MQANSLAGVQIDATVAETRKYATNAHAHLVAGLNEQPRKPQFVAFMATDNGLVSMFNYHRDGFITVRYTTTPIGTNCVEVYGQYMDNVFSYRESTHVQHGER
jgi:hypothetical protein